MVYSRELADCLIDHASEIDAWVDRFVRSIAGRRLLVAGNGGSAAIASHLVADVLKTVVSRTSTPLVSSAVCLTDCVPLLTAMVNDYGHETSLSSIAAVNGICMSDVVLVISSSGNSANVCELLRLAAAVNADAFAMVGFDGGIIRAEPLVVTDSLLHVKRDSYSLVEDVHGSVVHSIVERACSSGG